MMARLNESLTDDTAIVADVGDALFAATELVVRTRTNSSGPPIIRRWASPFRRRSALEWPSRSGAVVVIVGDGAFQMTCMELSTIVRHGFSTIVIVLDNKGYGTERALHPGNFNAINPWQYHKLPEIFNGGAGYEVRTEGEFDAALRCAWPIPTA